MIRKLSGIPFVSFKSRDEGASISERIHSHRELSVGMVLCGSTRVTVEGLGFVLHSGDLILIPAEQVHLCKPGDLADFMFRMLYIDPDWTEEITGVSARILRPRAMVCPESWRHIFSRLEQMEDNPDDAGDLTALLAAALEELARPQLEETALPPAQDGRDPLRAVHQRITESPQMDMKVDEMAAMAAMSKYDFLRKYSSRFGITPHSSVTNRRIRRSLELMADGKDLTGIAAECGFSDQSHFIRQFRLYTGLKPSEYRKAILSN